MYGGGPRLDGGAGVGGVILGIPGTGGRQGGPNGRPYPSPPRAPDPNAPPGVDRPGSRSSPTNCWSGTAFPAGDFKGPVSGLCISRIGENVFDQVPGTALQGHRIEDPVGD